MGHTICKCHLINAFIKDITSDFSDWNESISDHQSDPELKLRFGNTVQLYANVKELSEMEMENSKNQIQFHLIPFVFRFICEFNATSEYSILVVFSYILLTMCSAFLVFMSQIVEYMHVHCHFDFSITII